MPKSADIKLAPSKIKDKIATSELSGKVKKVTKKVSSSKISKIFIKGIVVVVLIAAGVSIYYLSQKIVVKEDPLVLLSRHSNQVQLGLFLKANKSTNTAPVM